MQRLRQAVRTGMLAVARDATNAAATTTALVIAPHPDDETIGCGATILRKVSAGTSVTVAVVTDGRHSHRSAQLPPPALADLRRAEMAEAATRLGLQADDVRWGGFVDGTAADHEDDVAEYIAGLVTELKPDEIYATSADEAHADHAAVGRAARRAVREAGGQARLLEYPVWLWGGWPLRRGDRLASAGSAVARTLTRGVVRIRTGEYRLAKMHALDAHASQLRRPEPVPDTEPWAVLPATVLAAAGAHAELFFPYRPGSAR